MLWPEERVEMTYRVRFTLPERKLDNADIEFKIFQNGKRFGTLGVSQGAIVWWRHLERKGTRMSWAEFERCTSDIAGRQTRKSPRA
jgi:hypothetical protein